MLLYADIITIIISLPALIKTIQRIISLKCGMLDFCIIVFWSMQILPLLVLFSLDLDESIPRKFIMTNIAMNDVKTGVVYDILVITTIYILLFLSRKTLRNFDLTFLINNSIHIQYNQIIAYLLFIGMMLPVFVIVLSPHPSDYFHVGGLYQYNYEVSNESYTYFKQYVSVGRISAICALAMYFGRKRADFIHNLDIFISIIFITMLNQKRTLLIYILLGIIAIDLFNGNYKTNMKRLMVKGTVLLSIYAGYFFIYSQVSGKGGDQSFGYQYLSYFSRITALKTAIYDVLNGEKILSYHGESLLYNLLFFVPRSLWDTKPIMYVKHFTPYSVGFESTYNLEWNLHVNMWTEFVSNFHLMGQYIAIIFSYCITKVCEKSKSVICMLLGTVFLVLYYMYGFENLVQLIWVGFMFTLVLNKLRKMLLKENGIDETQIHSSESVPG